MEENKQTDPNVLVDDVRRLNIEEFEKRLLSGEQIPKALKQVHVNWLSKNHPQVLQYFVENPEIEAQGFTFNQPEDQPPADTQLTETQPDETQQSNDASEITQDEGLIGVLDRSVELEIPPEEEPDDEQKSKIVLGKEVVVEKTELQTAKQLGAPDRSFPSKHRKTAAQQAIPPSTVRNINNNIVPEDNCFHLSGWKGGCCTINGNNKCSFIGGNQLQCSVYLSKEDAKGMDRRKIQTTVNDT